MTTIQNCNFTGVVFDAPTISLLEKAVSGLVDAIHIIRASHVHIEPMIKIGGNPQITKEEETQDNIEEAPEQNGAE